MCCFSWQLSISYEKCNFILLCCVFISEISFLTYIIVIHILKLQNQFPSFSLAMSSADGRTFFSTVSAFFSLFLSNFSTPYWKIIKIIRINPDNPLIRHKAWSAHHGHVVLGCGVDHRVGLLQVAGVGALDGVEQVRGRLGVRHDWAGGRAAGECPDTGAQYQSNLVQSW